MNAGEADHRHESARRRNQHGREPSPHVNATTASPDDNNREAFASRCANRLGKVEVAAIEQFIRGVSMKDAPN